MDLVTWPTTPWSELLAHRGLSGEDRRASLNALLQHYWGAIRRYFEVAAPRDSAEEWAQAFALKFLEQDLPAHVDPERLSRFRCFLAVSLRHFRFSRQRHDRIATAMSVGTDTLDAAPASREFHKAWARLTVDRALGRMRATAGSHRLGAVRLRCFTLRYGLDDSPQYDDPISNAEIANIVGISTRQVEERLREAREWFRDSARAEVRLLVESDAWVDTELWSLAEALEIERPDT